jgi:esterase/lipase
MHKLETKFLELENIKVAYSEYGSGPNLILLHGNSLSKNIFKKYQVEIFPKYHTYAIDSRGHGESVSIDNSYSINQYSNDVIIFCKKLGIAKAFVIGYSDGGNISLFLAKKEPRLFEKIVAISPNYLVSGIKYKYVKFVNEIIKMLIFINSIGIDTKKTVMKLRLNIQDIGYDINELKTIDTSMKILFAEKDMIKEEHILFLQKMIPKSIIKKIAKCNHLSIMSKADTKNSILEYFEE